MEDITGRPAGGGQNEDVAELPAEGKTMLELSSDSAVFLYALAVPNMLVTTNRCPPTYLSAMRASRGGRSVCARYSMADSDSGSRWRDWPSTL
jgi:hypothetical protein